MVVSICEICLEDFTIFSRYKRRFCSVECRAEWLKASGIKPPPRTGISPWNKGLTGWTRYYENAGFQKGDKNPSWKNGSSTFKERHKQEWVIWRDAVFKRDNYTCQVCFQRGGILNPDHIKCFAHHPELRFVLSNGRTLCKSCHKLTPTYGFHDRAVCK